jgi:integrase
MATARTPRKRQTTSFEGATSGATDVPGVYWYTLKSGEIRFRCMWVSSNGVKEWKKGLASKDEAKAYRTERMAEALRGDRVHTADTFAVAYPAWLANKRSITQGTRDGYEDHFVKRLEPVFGELTLRKLDYDTIDNAVTLWLDDDADLSAKTINNAIGALSSFLTDMVRAGKVSQNYARLVERVSEDQIERDWLRESKGEIDLYLDACAPHYVDLADFLIGTGVRISEALAVKLPDLDYLDDCVVHIMRTRRDKAEERRAAGRRSRRSQRADREGDTKGKSFRAVAIGPELAQRLKTRVALLSEMSAEPMQTYLFQMPRQRPRGDRGALQHFAPNTPIDRSIVSRNWHKEALADAGLRDMPLHSLRHTAAALWLRDHDMEYVRRQLGHAQISTTTRIYGHLEQSVMAERAAATERRRRSARNAAAA